MAEGSLLSPELQAERLSTTKLTGIDLNVGYGLGVLTMNDLVGRHRQRADRRPLSWSFATPVTPSLSIPGHVGDLTGNVRTDLPRLGTTGMMEVCHHPAVEPTSGLGPSGAAAMSPPGGVIIAGPGRRTGS